MKLGIKGVVRKACPSGFLVSQRDFPASKDGALGKALVISSFHIVSEYDLI